MWERKQFDVFQFGLKLERKINFEMIEMVDSYLEK